MIRTPVLFHISFAPTVQKISCGSSLIINFYKPIFTSIPLNKKPATFITLNYHEHKSNNKLTGEGVVQKSKLSISKVFTAKNKLKQRLDSFFSA